MGQIFLAPKISVASSALKATRGRFRTSFLMLVIRLPIAAVAEEMSTSALQAESVADSVPKRVADRLCLPHKYCDPTQEQQVSLGIRDENTVAAYGREKGDEVEITRFYSFRTKN